jgi:hypothetical protein
MHILRNSMFTDLRFNQHRFHKSACNDTASSRFKMQRLRRCLLPASVAMLESDMETPSLITAEDKSSDDSFVSTPHPALPYVPAFKHSDVVYGSVLYSNAKGSRTNIMYHEGLNG